MFPQATLEEKYVFDIEALIWKTDLRWNALLDDLQNSVSNVLSNNVCKFSDSKSVLTSDREVTQ